MTKFIRIIIGLFICQNALSQKSDQDKYQIIDVVISELCMDEEDSLLISSNTVLFAHQNMFFTREFLESYTFPVVGVHGAKVKRLIKLMDFKYLSGEKSEIITLDTTMLKDKNFNLYDENNMNLLDGKKRYSFSEPIFSKDKRIAFVSIRMHCGHMDCSSEFVKVYKKREKKWVFFITIPIY